MKSQEQKKKPNAYIYIYRWKICWYAFEAPMGNFVVSFFVQFYHNCSSGKYQRERERERERERQREREIERERERERE